MIYPFFECPECNYVDNRLELANIQEPCPNCNSKGLSRRIFPGTSAIMLQTTISYFYKKASERVDDLKTNLVNKLQAEIGCTYDASLVTDTAREIQRIYGKEIISHDENDTLHKRILETIQERFSLQSEQQALIVFVPLLRYSETFEEHKAVVILTCALLEKLFADLLVKILSCKGIDFSRAVKKIEKLQSFDKRCDAFEIATGLSLDEAIGRCPIPAFFSNWIEVRKKRNNFIHKTPYAIDIKTAKKAFKLTENSFSVFAHLQNRFCVQYQAYANK